MSSDLTIGSNTERLGFYITKRFKIEFEKNWNFKKYPHTARLKPNPLNPIEKIPFVSQKDFFTTIFRAIFITGKFDYNFFMERNNPDHPDFPEELENE